MKNPLVLLGLAAAAFFMFSGNSNAAESDQEVIDTDDGPVLKPPPPTGTKEQLEAARQSNRPGAAKIGGVKPRNVY